MPLVLAWLVALGPVIVPLVLRALWALGFGVVSYVGISTMWDSIQADIWGNLGNTSASILTIIGLARVDDAIQVILSAASAVLLLKGLNLATGAISRFRMGGNPSAFENV